VIGHVFWDEALRAVAPGSVGVLDRLVDRLLINRRDTSTFAGVREYAFKHHLLHQVTYDTVLKSLKRDLHRRTANWLVASTGGRIGEHLGLIGAHYERAGDGAQAARYLGRASAAAYAAATFGPALDYADRALALVPEDDLSSRFELLRTRVNIYNATGRRAEQGADLAIQEAIAERLGDDRSRGQAARMRALWALVTGDYPAAIAASETAIALGQRCGDIETELGGRLERGQVYVYQHDLDAAQACFESSLPLARASGRADLECVAYNRLNTVAQQRTDFAEARAHVDLAIGVARASCNRRFEGALTSNRGLLEVRLGHLDVALELTQAGLDVSRAIGDRGSEPYAMHTIGLIAYHRGDARSALPIVLQAREIARAVADRGCQVECALLAGDCHADLGEYDEALACYDDCDSADGTQHLVGAANAGRALIALARGRHDEALAMATRLATALDALTGTAERDHLLQYFACHRVFERAGAPRAHEFLVRAHECLIGSARPLTEADRDSYFQNLRPHRDVMSAAVSASIAEVAAQA
jgi:tetratricopeptide (TPR) repeat protein